MAAHLGRGQRAALVTAIALTRDPEDPARDVDGHSRRRPDDRSPCEPLWVQPVLIEELHALPDDRQFGLELTEAFTSRVELGRLARAHAPTFTAIDLVLPDPGV